MKHAGSDNSAQIVDLKGVDSGAQTSQLSGAIPGSSGNLRSDNFKTVISNRRTLGVASILGLLFASLLAGTLFFTSADDSASSAPKVDAETVSDNTVSAHAQLKPAEFTTANSFYHSVLDPANASASPKAGGALAASRNQGAAETSAAQPSSANSARSQCSGAACVSPRRAPVQVKVRLFKLGVADSALVKTCTVRNRVCAAKDGELVGGARFALYEGRTVDEANKLGEYTVGEGGFELPGLQAGKSYTLKEVAAPAGYELNLNTVTFTVANDGKVYRQYSKFTYYFENNEFYFPNLKAPEPEVWLFKLGVKDLKDCTWGTCSADVAGSEVLGGATFALYEGSTVDTARKVGEDFTVGVDGVKLSGLQVGKTYTLEEAAAPAGYEANPDTYTFEVGSDGKAKYQTDNGSQIFADNKIYFPDQKKAAPPAVKLRLFKLGVADSATVTRCARMRLCTAADGEIVGGARFALYKGTVADEANKLGEYTVGKDGVELPGLQAGNTYTLKEVAAPAGYILNPNSYTLRVGDDGRVGVQIGKKTIYPNGEFYFPNLKAPEPEVWLFKLGVKDLKDCTWGTCSADVAGSEVLGGATFALYEGSTVDTARKVGEDFTVGVDGVKLSGLQVGKTYTLEEAAAPAGYEANPDTYTFEVGSDGKAKYQTDNGSQIFADNKIYFPDQKKAAPPAVKLRLFKLGVADSATVTRCARMRLCTAADGEIVGGARFALYKGTVADEANKLGEYTVGKDGVELPGLQAGNTYTLKEVAAPAGYILNPNSYTLRVGDDGRVGVQIGKKTIYPNGEFYFPNLKAPVPTIDISLNKVSDNDTALPNVKFDLYEADNLAKPVQNITTGNDGKANLTVMPGRKYRLVETATAPGYALLPQAIEFQVEANGTVTIDTGTGNVNTVTGGDKTLKVINYPEGKLPFSGQSGFLVVLLSGLSLLLVAVAISLVGRKRN